MAHKPLDDKFLERHLPRRRTGGLEALKADEPIADQITAAPASDPNPAPAPEAAPAPPMPEPAAVKEPEAAQPPPPPSPSAPAPEPSVPVHLYRDLRTDLKREREERERLARELEEARRPKPVESKQPEDPEPDPRTHPVEHDQWELRQLRRDNAALRKDIDEIKTGYQARTEQERQAQAIQEFNETIEAIVQSYKTGARPDGTKIADIEERRQYLRNLLRNENIDAGYDPVTAAQLAQQQEFTFYVDCARRQVDPIATLAKLAERRGYKAAGAAPGEMLVKSDADRIADKARRQDAARSTGSMPGAPPPRVNEERMTAERWARMTPAQKKAYYRDNPDARKRTGGIASLLLDDTGTA